MTKSEILAEIRRTAEANGGVPLGTSRFRTETGIKRADWYGRYWSSWGEAVQEAGLQAQDWISAVPEERLLEQYVALVRTLGRVPRDPEVRMRRRTHPEFPSHGTFGGLAERRSCLHERGITASRVRKMMSFRSLTERWPKSPLTQPIVPHQQHIRLDSSI